MRIVCEHAHSMWVFWGDPGEQEWRPTLVQVVMVWAGAGLLTLTFSFLVLCIWVGIRAPALSVQGVAGQREAFQGSGDT